MGFHLQKEQQMIKEMVREFAEKEIKPIAIELDAKSMFAEGCIQKWGNSGCLEFRF